MHPVESDKVFAGSIPAFYERYLVPLIFQPYASDLARRAAAHSPRRVLEIACGTGALTRALDQALPASATIVATDLNEAMLGHGAVIGTARPVAWRRADAMQLPFDDGTFDLVACQFGCMFFPDKARAFAEARRVLARGGTFLFNVWDRIEENAFADVVTTALATLFPDDPPRFLARTPHGYADPHAVARDLAQGGFDGPPEIETLAARSRAASPEIPSVAYCQGTPLRNEIEARGTASLAEATDHATEAMARAFGPGEVDGKIQAHVIAVRR